eukprot:g4319.t1
MTPLEILQIVLWPSLSLLFKVRRQFFETLRQNGKRFIDDVRGKKSIKVGRGRESVYGVDHDTKVSHFQNRALGSLFKRAVFGFSVLYIIAMSVILVTQLARANEVDGDCKYIFVKNPGDRDHFLEDCSVKVMFCKNVVEPSCDCAVLDIVNHNMTRLKNNFTTLTALNWLRINTGPLESLPTSGMEDLTKITVLYLDFNFLTSFKVDVSFWPSLLVAKQ